jgi:(2Fe-2S) ferredoxin
MSENHKTPYLCHIFVCTNDRSGERKSCGDEEGVELRAVLKSEIGSRGWRRWVRLTQSGCLGKCAQGPNVMIYPQGIWFSKTTLDDVDSILEVVQDILAQSLDEVQPS